MYLLDGHIVSHAIRSKKNPKSVTNYNKNSLVKARIDKVIYPDNPSNSTFNSDYKMIEYECTIVGGVEDSKKLFNVIDSQGGSQFNHGFRVRTPTTNAQVTNSSESSETYPSKSNGEFVIIQRLFGNGDVPIIIGNFPSPMNKSFPKEADGIAYTHTFNGMTISISKDGSFSLVFGGGPQDQNGTPSNQSAAGSSFSIDSNGNMNFANGAGQKLSLNRENNTVTMGADGNSIEINTSSGNVTFGNSGDMSMDSVGNIEIKGGGIATLKASLAQIQSGGMPAARMGDQCIGVGNLGAPVISTIIQGSGTCLIGG